MLKVMNPGKILKGRDIQACINKWEGYMNMLERDYKETILEPNAHWVIGPHDAR